MRAIKTQTGRTFPSGFLTDNPTLVAIEAALCGRGPPPPAQLLKALGQVQQLDTNQPLPSPSPSPSSVVRKAKSFHAGARLLQSGTSASSTEPALLLLPDGSGSESSYIGLPRLNLRGAVYGLDSPSLADPAAFSPAACSLTGATS